jgi:hypothetical protein
LGNHPRHFRLAVCNLLRAVSVINRYRKLTETRQSRAGKNPIVGLDILDEIFIPSDLDISLRIRGLSLVRRPPADEVCVSGRVDRRDDIHPVGLRRFEAGARGRTTALCVRLLSRDLCSVQRDRGCQTKSLDQFPTDHNLLSNATQFGDKVKFMPKQRIQFWRIEPVVKELKQLAGLVAPGPDIR